MICYYAFCLIQGKELCNKWSYDKPKGLPTCWIRESYGCLVGGADYIKGGQKFMGPEKTKDTPYEIVQKHYDVFGVNIRWETNTI